MKPLSFAAAWLFAVVVVAGCASTEVTERQRYDGEKLARPDRIIVHDFTANPADVPPESALAAQMTGASPVPVKLPLRAPRDSLISYLSAGSAPLASASMEGA
jgi:hypothetical protein